MSMRIVLGRSGMASGFGGVLGCSSFRSRAVLNHLSVNMASDGICLWVLPLMRCVFVAAPALRAELWMV